MSVLEFNMLNALYKIAPVIFVMGVVIYFMYKELQRSQQCLENLHQQSRDREGATLTTLQSINGVLDRISVNTAELNTELRHQISDAVDDTKIHVTERTAMLSDQIRQQQPPPR